MVEKVSTLQPMGNPRQSRWLFPEELEPLEEPTLQQGENGGRKKQQRKKLLCTD